MKKFLSKISILTFLMLASTYVATAANVFKISDFSIAPGETKAIDVILSADVEVSNFNLKVHLPDGLSFAGTNNDANFKYTDTYVGGLKSANVQADGGLYIMGSTGKAAAGESTLLTFEVTASETFDGGTITVDNIKINKERPSTFSVNVTKTAAEDPIVGYKFIIEDFSIKPGDTKAIDVILSAEGEVSNFNLKVHLPDGLSFAGSNNDANFKYSDVYVGGLKSANVQSDGGLYIMGSTGKAAAGKAVLVTFEISAASTFSGGKLTIDNQKINKVRPETFTVNAALPTGIDNVENNVENAVVYDLAGRRVNANAKGLLIKGGKKYVVK